MLEFNIGVRPTRTQSQYTLQDANLDELNQWSSKIFDKPKTIPELRDVATGSSFDRAAFVALIG
jgi:hydrophobic/amphiphilic exporter-1 (mainly G- bacteria), HAE1 family